MAEHDDHARALEALADGEDLQTDAQDDTHSPEGGPGQQHQGDDPLGGISEGLAQAKAIGRRSRSRTAQAARQNAASRRASQSQFRKAMIPPLMVSGILMILLAVAMLILQPAGAGDGLLSATVAKALTFAAFPLGAILMVGAWWLHHDSNRP
jgi:hypothetical protein